MKEENVEEMKVEMKDMEEVEDRLDPGIDLETQDN